MEKYTKVARGIWAELKPGPANYAPLSPIVFLPRAAEIHPDRVAVVHGAMRTTYAEFFRRAQRLASALHKAGIRKGDVVAAMLPNVAAMLDARFGPVRQPRPAARFDRTPATIAAMAPFLGEHNAAILGELGFSPADIERLSQANVTHQRAAGAR